MDREVGISMISDFKIAVIFLVVGFLGIFDSAIADSNDERFVAGLFIALAIGGLGSSLGFVIKSWNKENKKDEEKQS